MTSGEEGTAPEIRGFHPPHQKRSRQTLERLTGVVEEILVESGPMEISVRELVARADTSVGAFYARFDDRDAALSYTSHSFWARSRRAWADYLAPRRWEGVPASVIVAGVVRTFARVMLGDAPRLRAFVRVSLAVPGAGLTVRIAEHDRYIASCMADLLAGRAVEIRHPSPREAADHGFRRVLSAVRDYAVYEADGTPAPGEVRELILCLCGMYGRYLDVHPVPESYAELLGLVKRSPWVST